MTTAVQSSSQMSYIPSTATSPITPKQTKASSNIPSMMSMAASETPKATSGNIGTGINTKA